MGLKDLFKKNKANEAEKSPSRENEPHTQEKTVDDGKPKEENLPSFYLGVLDSFHLINSENLVVFGNLKGTVHVGDAVYVTNPGDDNASILLTTVLGIEISKGVSARTASDRFVSIMLENASKQNIKCGTVIFTRNISGKDVHNAYISALGDEYIKMKSFELTDEDFKVMSLTDCCETLSLFTWYNSKYGNKDDAEKKANEQKELYRCNIIKDKLLSSEAVYTVYNKLTGEPHLFSHTVDNQNGSYMCTPPSVRVITKAYKSRLEKFFPENMFEIIEIKNGENGKGIENFLGSAFYLDGACSVAINDENTVLDKSLVVKEPDYSNLPKIRVPVTNPDLERWILLIGQMGKADTPDKETIFKLYDSFLLRELPKAKLLIPMKHEGEIPAPDENGKTVLKKDVHLLFSTVGGKNGRDAIRMYTDWKRFNEGMEKGFEGMIQPIEGIIDKFDVAINLTPVLKAGCYIDRDSFNRSLELLKKKD